MDDETRTDLLRWLAENDPMAHACVARIVDDAANENLVDLAREAAMDLEDSLGEAYEAGSCGFVSNGPRLDWLMRLPASDERAVAVTAAFRAGSALPAPVPVR